MVDKRKKYLPQHPTNAVPVPTDPHFGTEMGTSPVPQIPGQELDPALLSV